MSTSYEAVLIAERDAAKRDLAAIKADRDKILRCEEETEKKLAETKAELRKAESEYKRLLDALRNKPIDETIGKPRWRVGRTSGRTLYRDEESVGRCDTPEIAAEIVERMNR